MSIIKNYSEYDVICNALLALEDIASQESESTTLKGHTYELLNKLANDYTSGKTAEDYFKELNFTKKVHENFNSIIYYSNTNEWLAIAFYLDTHEVKLINNEDKYITIDPDLNKAIQMQILELGWK